MRRPTVILADMDYNYLQALEIRFVELFGSRIELHVITNKMYFTEFFSTQREASVLVVSEGLYSENLKRHDLKRVVVLSERVRETVSHEGAVWVNKYSSVKEIVNEAACEIHMGRENDGGKRSCRIITVCSASGGAGKTSIALGLARCLARRHKRVLCLSAEPMQSFSYYLSDKVYLDAEACRLLRDEGRNHYRDVKPFLRNEGFTFMPPLPAAADTLSIKGSMFRKLADEAKASGEYDFIIVDADDVLSGETAVLIAHSDVVQIVVRQDGLSVEKAEFLLRNLDLSDEEKYLFVCNCFDETQKNAIRRGNVGGRQISAYIEKLLPDPDLSDLEKCEGIQALAYMLL